MLCSVYQCVRTDQQFEVIHVFALFNAFLLQKLKTRIKELEDSRRVLELSSLESYSALCATEDDFSSVSHSSNQLQQHIDQLEFDKDELSTKYEELKVLCFPNIVMVVTLFLLCRMNTWSLEKNITAYISIINSLKWYIVAMLSRYFEQ